MREMRRRFREAWETGEYQGEFFDFESPMALFRVLTPKRWQLLETLQAQGPMGVRALAQALERDVRRVHDDAQALIKVGLVEKDEHGKLAVPFAEIHADFILRKNEAA
jgi:predicted transcriptional regulator